MKTSKKDRYVQKAKKRAIDMVKVKLPFSDGWREGTLVMVVACQYISEVRKTCLEHFKADICAVINPEQERVYLQSSPSGPDVVAIARQMREGGGSKSVASYHQDTVDMDSVWEAITYDTDYVLGKKDKEW